MRKLLTTLSCLLVFALQAGCSSINKENLNPYEGLLQPGTAPAESRQAFNPALLKKKRAVLVASNSYEAHVKQYVDYYEGGSGERYKYFLIGLNTVVKAANPGAAAVASAQGAADPESLYDSMRKAQDPRMLTDRITKVLLSQFGRVSAAADFAEAQEQSADYVVLVDYWWKPNAMGSAFTGAASVYVLDNQFNKVFAVEARHTAPRPGVSAAETFQQIHAELSRQVTAELSRKLATEIAAK